MIPSPSSSSICFRISLFFTEDCIIGEVRFELTFHFDQSISIVYGVIAAEFTDSELLNMSEN